MAQNLSVPITRRSLMVGVGAATVVGRRPVHGRGRQDDLVEIGAARTFPSTIPGVAQIRVREVTYQPGGKTSYPMRHSMVCECTAGVLEISQDEAETTMNAGDMWTCHPGMVEGAENRGTVPAVMRVIELMPA